MWKFVAGFVTGLVLMGAGALYLLYKIDRQMLVFPRKEFMDLRTAEPGHGYVMFAGTITGPEGADGVGNRNNHFRMECDQARNQCDVIDFAQIGPNQIGAANLEHWTIQRWTPDLIVVRSNAPATACSHVIVNILRRTREVQYIREPQMQNATAPDCQNVEMRLFRWTIEDSPWWRDMDSRGRR